MSVLRRSLVEHAIVATLQNKSGPAIFCLATEPSPLFVLAYKDIPVDDSEVLSSLRCHRCHVIMMLSGWIVHGRVKSREIFYGQPVTILTNACRKIENA